ncbi:MAG: hypothetical protein IJ661_00835 [Lachnospiraceae bacterium]|nr:hypothetical protein [Lachnospiraceae bacterium]
MTVTVVVMILLGIAFVIASFIISEKLTKNEDNVKLDLMTVDDNYEFSERELQIIKRKIEDVIANQAKDILYQTNESLSNMANEKTMALGDYAVAVCEDIEKNHKEVMFLYSMLDDKQKEIMKTVKDVDASKQEAREILSEARMENEKLLSTFELSNDRNTQMADASRHTVNAEAHHNIDNEQLINEQMNNIPADNDQNAANASKNLEEKDFGEESLDDELDNIFDEIDKTDIDFDEVLENDFKNDSNANEIILEMYQNGHSIIDIAKELGLGVGEVKLVIDLYQGA